MLDNFLSSRAAVERLREGLLGPYLDSFLAAASRLGYARSTVRERLWLLGDLARWLERGSLAVGDLKEQVVSRFLKDRQSKGRLRRSDSLTVRHFLEHLRQKGVVGSPVPALDEPPLQTLQQRYENYLEKERGLSPVTVTRYWPFVRRLIVERFGDEPLCFRKLAPGDVSSFLLRHARSGSPRVASLMVTALRSFFRFLFLRGETESDLAGAVPAVPQWRLAELPKHLTPEEVEQVVRACELETPVGRRDHAILLLLARLGLRASEVVALELDDVDWRAGVLKVRGKGRHHDRLPLPADVGGAVAAYLRHHRPTCATRRLFIRARAPHRGLANPSSISTIVCRALTRAGLQPDFKGAHVLRHSLAARMLRARATLDEIGYVLRYRATNTTEIYTKVDVQGLRTLALPWPTKGSES